MWRRCSSRFRLRPIPVALGFAALAACTPAPPNFVNWENHPVHGLEITPDGTRLLVADTPDNRLEIFSLTGSLPVEVGQVPVGLDPVSVRARTSSEAWVVNRISDSISVVNLDTLNVVATLPVGDEPADVVFAGSPQRAFASISQENAVKIFDPANLSTPPMVVPIQGQGPRALATDGNRVYAAIFESGNATTLIPYDTVSDPAGPYGGQNPPPNKGTAFSPPMSDGLPPPPVVSLIVRKNHATGQWLDDNGQSWNSIVTWDLDDHDVAIIPVADPTNVAYAVGLMNLDMSLTVTNTGRVAVVGTEALNQVRFEPNVRSQFVRDVMAVFDPGAPGNPSVVDLNPQLDYTAATLPQATRNQALGDPRSIVWSSGLDTGFVSGMGSNNVVKVSASGARLGRVDVGKGPTSMALDEARSRLYVFNRFDSTLSVINTQTFAQVGLVAFYDPTPQTIRNGRPMLYDTHANSGLGQVACASCHVDGRTDHLAWDLGNPAGSMKTFDQQSACRVESNQCEDWHPMKGPLLTQTFQHLRIDQPMHWRGDRENLAAFSPAFESLMGDDAQPTADQMTALESFLTDIRFPPNPYRQLDGSLVNGMLANGGNPQSGEHIFNDVPLNAGLLLCPACHEQPNGANGQIVPGPQLFLPQQYRVAPLQNIYERAGFNRQSLHNILGFGFLHDGSDDSIITFLHRDIFSLFEPGEAGEQQRRDIEAFLFSFSTDTPAAVGVQLTVNAGNQADPATLARIQQLEDVVDAQSDALGLVAKYRAAGVQRGAFYLGADLFQTDLAAEQASTGDLLAGVADGSEVTFTVVPAIMAKRVGVDRDSDGKYDRDEILAGTNPANPGS